MNRPVRVLVVDDSAFARKVLREILTKPGEIEVVDIARDGLEALEKIAELRPDVVTLDLVMPGLDGIGVLHALPAVAPPRVIVVSMSDADSDLGVEALQSGAFDLVHKPTALATERLYELAGELVTKVIAAASARQPALAAGAPSVLPAGSLNGKRDIVVVGTSTGGPQALTHLVSALPADFPVPMAIVLHIPVGYTESLARRLDRASQLEVCEASPGLPLRPGRVVLARAGIHLKIDRKNGELTCRLDVEPLASLHTPSVDALFESAAEQCGERTVGVVLTGLGSDGLKGAGLVHKRGGVMLTQSEASCVIYGMPRSIVEAQLSDAQAELDGMARLITAHL
ncbi:MAG: chemotaxis-specific protein-glutamate methyltransferase CheB [Polyangiaceae bacterium]